MRIFSIYFGVLLATLGVRHHFVVGFVLDPHKNSRWLRSSEMIHEITRRQTCNNGRPPILTGIKADGELYTYDLQCEGIRDIGFDRRDTVQMCTTTCTEVCYTPADYNPDPKDCSNATAILNQQNGHWDIPVGGTKVVKYNTCTYYFVNQGHNTINFCDTALASIGNKIAWDCGRWLPNPAKGGICTNNDFYVMAVRTPNMPAPSYSIKFSTVAETQLDTLTDMASQSTLTTNTSPGSSSASGSTFDQSGSNTTSGAMQTLAGVPSVTFADGQLSGGASTLGDSAQPSVGPSSSSNKVDTAAAVGGTIAGIAFLVLVVASIVLYRRMERRDELADQQANELVSHMTQVDPESTWPRARVYHISEKRPREGSSVPATSSIVSHVETGTPLDNADANASVVSHGTENVYPRPHPRSTEALIAAAAPPNMSREQIDLLAANFVSLVRGRHPREDQTDDGDVPELPPYHRA